MRDAIQEIDAAGRRELPDAALVAAARRGDSAAFRSIYERYAPRLYGLCAGATGSRAEGCDLLQEVFFQAHRSLASLRQPERLREWLFAIAMNAVRAHAGTSARTRDALERLAPELPSALDPEEQAQPLWRELRIETVREVLAQVEDVRERRLLERYYATSEPRTTRELAAEFGLPASTVTVTLMRARAKIARRVVAALALLEGGAGAEAEAHKEGR